MPFPDTWPVYIPKDKLADWLEFYAESMELNIWTRTVFLGGEYDSAARRWTVRLSRADGTHPDDAAAPRHHGGRRQRDSKRPRSQRRRKISRGSFCIPAGKATISM